MQRSTPIELARKIDSGEIKGNTQVTEGDTYGRGVADELRKLGWVTDRRGSTMTKATFEAQLKKDKRRIWIISAVFLGPYTEIELT
jgi:hypothetical protein